MLTYDPYDPTWLTEGVPFDHLARIRHEGGIARTPQGAWYLATQADIAASLKEVDLFRADLAGLAGVRSLDDVPEEQLFLSEILEPRHGQVRRLFNASFGPHRLREAEPFVRAACNGLVDRLFEQDTPDLHEGYAMPIPGIVMAEIMGFGDEAVELFMRWSFDGSIMTRPCTPGVGEEGPPIQAWFRERLAEQQALPEPTNHVFKTLMQAEVEGRPLTEREIVTQLHFMIQAGVHTTRGFLTHAVQRLLMEPDLFARLQADRSLVPVFCEESLRHDAPVQRTTRRCMRDVEFHGVQLRAGDSVEVGIASANRDEAVYDDPESFRLDRSDPRDHLAFGGGSHVCPGATLARLEGVTAVDVLLDRCRRMEPVDGYRYPPIPGNLGHMPIPARLVAS
jgi:cytochrome P450